MSQIYLCPKCGLVYKNGVNGQKCTDCGVLLVNSGYSEDRWYALPRAERDQIKANLLKPERDKAKAFEESVKNMIVSSCQQIEGYRVIKQLGLVFGECIFKSGFFNRLTASWNNFGDLLSFGDAELSGSGELMKAAREYAINKMKEEAVRKEANAILGVDAESSIGGEIIHIMIYGTAVQIEQKTIEKPPV